MRNARDFSWSRCALGQVHQFIKCRRVLNIFVERKTMKGWRNWKIWPSFFGSKPEIWSIFSGLCRNCRRNKAPFGSGCRFVSICQQNFSFCRLCDLPLIFFLSKSSCHLKRFFACGCSLHTIYLVFIKEKLRGAKTNFIRITAVYCLNLFRNCPTLSNRYFDDWKFKLLLEYEVCANVKKVMTRRSDQEIRRLSLGCQTLAAILFDLLWNCNFIARSPMLISFVLVNA